MIQMCGRLERKVEQLSEGHRRLLGRRQEELAHLVEHEKTQYERLLGLAEERRDPSDRIPSEDSKNPVFERVDNAT